MDLPPKRAIEYGLLYVHLYSTWINATKNIGVKDEQVTLNEEEHMCSNQDSRAPIGRKNQRYRAQQCKLSYYYGISKNNNERWIYYYIFK